MQYLTTMETLLMGMSVGGVGEGHCQWSRSGFLHIGVGRCLYLSGGLLLIYETEVLECGLVFLDSY